MSIYIKNMEMPETCDMCPLLAFVEQGEDHEAFCYCRLNNWKKSCTPEPITVFQARRFRHLECSLIELPEHGRLIDADEMKGSIRKQTAFLRLLGEEFAEIAETLEKGFLQEIDNAPTIIPAVTSEMEET